MNRPQVAHFLSGVLVYFPSGATTLQIPKRAQDHFGRNGFTAIALGDRFEKLCLCRRIELEGFVRFASENRDDGAVW